MIHKRPFLYAALAIIAISAVFLTSGGSAAAEKPLYLDPSQPIEKRVDDLLGRMTLAEKIGQMNMPCVYIGELGQDPASKREGCRRFTRGTLVAGLGPGGGFFTLADNALPEGSRQQAEFFNELQKIAIETTRLKIPLLQSEEGTHGVMCSGKTIFPEGLAIGSSWNLDLVRQIYTDVPEFLHAAAAMSVEAHLRKLERDGLARHADGEWESR